MLASCALSVSPMPNSASCPTSPTMSPGKRLFDGLPLLRKKLLWIREPDRLYATAECVTAMSRVEAARADPQERDAIPDAAGSMFAWILKHESRRTSSSSGGRNVAPLLVGLAVLDQLHRTRSLALPLPDRTRLQPTPGGLGRVFEKAVEQQLHAEVVRRAAEEHR